MTYLGFAGREAVSGGERSIQNGLIALALIAELAFLPRLVARLRQRPLLSAEGLKGCLDAGEDLLMLDVRTAADFVGEHGHIAGARNLPLEDLPAGLTDPESPLGPDPERPMALVCRTDHRSAKAALLARHGFAEVHVIPGGMTAWLANGWPVEHAHP